MSIGKTRDLQKEQEWRWRIRQWKRSGLKVSAFCRRYGLTEARFYAWRRMLTQRDAGRAAFVPVRVLADKQPANDGTLELILAGGRRLRLPTGFDAATLRQALAVLEEEPRC